MTTRRLRSSWLRSATYQPLGHGRGLLVLETHRGRLLGYGPVPSWLPGLLHAAPSPGRFYNLAIRGRFELLHQDQLEGLVAGVLGKVLARRCPHRGAALGRRVLDFPVRQRELALGIGQEHG